MAHQRTLPQSKEALLKSYTSRLKDDVKSMLENFEGKLEFFFLEGNLKLVFFIKILSISHLETWDDCLVGRYVSLFLSMIDSVLKFWPFSSEQCCHLSDKPWWRSLDPRTLLRFRSLVSAIFESCRRMNFLGQFPYLCSTEDFLLPALNHCYFSPVLWMDFACRNRQVSQGWKWNASDQIRPSRTGYVRDARPSGKYGQSWRVADETCFRY